MAAPLLLHIEGPIATITFNRPERRNAITFDMWNHLQRLFVDVKENPQVRVVILHGAGQEGFAAGADISEFGDRRTTPEARAAYDRAAAEAGMEPEGFLAHLRGMVDRKLLRRVAAILYHRRAGFSANGMGVWKVPEEEVLETGRRMAAFRGISHCYQRPTYPDWPYSVFTMAHGRSKEECDAILDAIASEHPEIEDRATLYSSTEFKKIRLLYFTDDFRRWEREHAGV
jgi:DNA-binding Lrp family transcriptional regulator